MLDIRLMREKLEWVKERVATRGAKIDWREFAAVERERREALAKWERLKERKNKLSSEIGRLKKSGGDATSLMREVEEVSEDIRREEAPLAEIEKRFEVFMLRVPNLPHQGVPHGRGPEDNREIRRWGGPRKFDFNPKSHWEIGEELGILDFARAAKIAGARFAVYCAQGALLERALINFCSICIPGSAATRKYCLPSWSIGTP